MPESRDNSPMKTNSLFSDTMRTFSSRAKDLRTAFHYNDGEECKRPKEHRAAFFLDDTELGAL